MGEAVWKFRSKQTFRDLEILKLLYIYKRTITIHELSDYLNCDIKTIRTHLFEIDKKYDLPSINYDYEIDSVQVSNAQSFWPFKVYKQFYANTLEFQVLEYIFVTKNLTTYKILDEFSISDSTLLRIINNLNYNLKKWNIQIRTRDYEIVGDEIAITRIFTQYFVEKTCTDYFEAFTDYQSAIFNIYLDILEEKDAYELRYYFNRFQWYIFVSLIRYSKNHPIPQARLTDLKALNLLQTTIEVSDKRVIESVFGFSFDDSNMLNDIFYFYINNIEVPEFNKYTYDKDSVDSLLNELIVSFGLDYSERDREKYSRILFENLNQFFVPSYFLFDRPAYEVEKLKALYPSSIAQLELILSEYLKSQTDIIDDSLCNHLILFIITVFPQMTEQINQFEEKIFVQCVLVSNKENKAKLASFLENNFSFVAQFSYYDESILPDEKQLNTGVWITDIPALSADNILVLSPNLLIMQAHEIYSFLKRHQDMLEKENQALR